jgi:hypothetical protein
MWFTEFYMKYRINENLNAVLMRFVLQGYVAMILASMITISLISEIDIIFTSKNDTFCFLLGSFFMAYIVVLPLFIQNIL